MAPGSAAVLSKPNRLHAPACADSEGEPLDFGDSFFWFDHALEVKLSLISPKPGCQNPLSIPLGRVDHKTLTLGSIKLQSPSSIHHQPLFLPYRIYIPCKWILLYSLMCPFPFNCAWHIVGAQ